MNLEETQYFTDSDIKLLQNLGGKELSGVSYFIWENVAKKNETFSFLLAAELCFSDGARLMISSGDSEELPHIALNQLNLEEEKKMVKESFGGALQIKTTDATNSDLWKSLTGKQIAGIELAAEEGTKKPFASHFIIRIDDTPILIRTGDQGDGIHIEYYLPEEDE
ncbi:MAG: hypothetical protein ACK4ND_14835 [Cytophagaceae bacterium]